MFEATSRYVVDVFILGMLFWIIFWDAEPRNPIKKFWIPTIQPAFVWLGLHANWAMFSPDPPNRTIWPMVRMVMKNHDIVNWEPAPIETMAIWEKIRFKKFHKFYHEVARPGIEYQTKRDFVEYLLRRRFHPEPCVKVEIFMVFKAGRPYHERLLEPLPASKRLVFTFFPAPIERADS